MRLGSGEEDLGFGFDDEEGVGVGAAGGAEFFAGVVEGVGQGRRRLRGIADDDRVESRAGLRGFASGKKALPKRNKDTQSSYVLLA